MSCRVNEYYHNNSQYHYIYECIISCVCHIPKDYKKVHKHCNVPRAHKPLGSWVKRQREFMKLHQGKVVVGSSLSMYRYNKLVSLGLQSTLGKGINTSQWEQRYEELLSFHTENGHCDVLTTRKGLGRWVCTQRSVFAKKSKGDMNAVEKSRYRKLREIGFSFHVGKGNRRRQNNTSRQRGLLISLPLPPCKVKCK